MDAQKTTLVLWALGVAQPRIKFKEQKTRYLG